MIELTEEQLKSLREAKAGPQRIVDPGTNETFVLIRLEEYDRLREQAYDDSSWTREELQAVAWQTVEQTDWNEYDDAQDKS